MPAKLDFWFDFASTYSYLSAMRIEEVAAESGIEVRWMPFLLGPIFGEQGWNTSPFNIYEAKGRYMWRDMERIAAERGLAFNRPETFPQFTLTAARVGVAAADEPWLGAFCRALFHAEYVRGEEITDDEAIAAALAEAGVVPDDWLRQASLPATKQVLRDRVEKARSLGIFGAPTFVTGDGELFWGDDRLDAAVAWACEN